MAGRFRELTTVQVRVSIDRIEPQLWRRLVVPSHFNLRELHLVLQAAFGWMNAHLHEFEIGGLRYGNEFLDIERAYDDPRIFEETEVRLRDFTREPGTEFRYVYDMGDKWLHTVCLERHLEEEPAPKVARCVEGVLDDDVFERARLAHARLADHQEMLHPIGFGEGELFNPGVREHATNDGSVGLECKDHRPGSAPARASRSREVTSTTQRLLKALPSSGM